MYPYPRTYPSEAVQLIAEYLSGRDDTIEKKNVLHAAWVLSGYTLSKMFGGGPAVIGKKFKVTKLPTNPEKRKKFFDDLAKANRYGTIKNFEQENPSCWHHLNELAELARAECS